MWRLTPSSRPARALDENQLRRSTRGTDAVNCGLHLTDLQPCSDAERDCGYIQG